MRQDEADRLSEILYDGTREYTVRGNDDTRHTPTSEERRHNMPRQPRYSRNAVLVRAEAPF